MSQPTMLDFLSAVQKTSVEPDNNDALYVSDLGDELWVKSRRM